MPIGPTAKGIYFSGRGPKNQIPSAIATPARRIMSPVPQQDQFHVFRCTKMPLLVLEFTVLPGSCTKRLVLVLEPGKIVNQVTEIIEAGR